MTEPWLSWLLNVGKSIAMGAAFWLLWSLRGAFAAGLNIQKFVNRFEEAQKDAATYKRDTDKDITELQRRMNVAGAASSDLATEVQGMPERIRAEFRLEFMPRREAELIASESKVDRQRLHDEDDKLWKVVNRREEGGRHR